MGSSFSAANTCLGRTRGLAAPNIPNGTLRSAKQLMTSHKIGPVYDLFWQLVRVHALTTLGDADAVARSTAVPQYGITVGEHRVPSTNTAFVISHRTLYTGSPGRLNLGYGTDTGPMTGNTIGGRSIIDH